MLVPHPAGAGDSKCFNNERFEKALRQITARTVSIAVLCIGTAPSVQAARPFFTDDAREFWFKLDGRNIYPNPQGPNGLGQTVAMWLVDRNTIYRERATKGVVDERVMYRVSPDGKTLVWTNLNADGNSGHQVWDRIDLPRR